MKFITYSFLFLFLGLSHFSCEKFNLESNTDTFFHVRTNGADLPVWVRGNSASKKFIIYINGGPGATSIDLASADVLNWADGLEDNFAMVYYDQRGCGNAQGNIDENTLTIAQYIKDLDAIITTLKVNYDDPKIFLMGASFGGFIGVNYLLADNNQDKISGWISVDGAYNFDFDLSWQYRRTFLINIANEELAKGNNVDHWNEALNWTIANPVIESRDQKNEWRSFIGEPGGIIIPEELASISLRQYLKIGFASSYNPFPAFLSRNLEIVNNKLNEDAEGKNMITSVTALTLPTVIMTGKYDDLIVPEESAEVFSNFGTPDAAKEFVIFPNSSHEPYISDPTNFKQTVIDFVSSN